MMTRWILKICVAAFLGLAIYYYRRGRPFHAVVDLLFAIGLIGVLLSTPNL